jgi:hypothetical protein
MNFPLVTPIPFLGALRARDERICAVPVRIDEERRNIVSDLFF